MDQLYPIYTQKTECQDCYKCVRHCPVKAIKVENGHASVVPDLCIACGHCVQVCPAKAKRVRNDQGRFKQLLKEKASVFVSLAPSWVSEFRDVTANQMISVLKALGFSGVSETALGAQEVSATVAAMLKEHQDGLHISSACPAAVNFIQKYLPERTADITAMLSPVLAHCKMLKGHFGQHIGVVMISPCVSKKTEADEHPELMDLALTFCDLYDLMKEAEISFKDFPREGEEVFVPERSEEGAVYPVEGGMVDTIKGYPGLDHVVHTTLTGIHEIDNALSNLFSSNFGQPVFAEVLACDGGCINGPCITRERAGLLSRLRVIDNTKFTDNSFKRQPKTEIKEQFSTSRSGMEDVCEYDIRNALKKVGKHSIDDELNCGGCGYESCRHFAGALHRGYAEPAMCVSYLRKQSQKKANALLRCIPSGVVIADSELQIIECNERFANMFDPETARAYEAKPGLSGAFLDRIIPFADLFKSALHSGSDIHRDSMKVNDKLLNVTVFTIDPQQVVGAVIFDVTQSEMRREQIADKARDVIDKNLATVQEIACKLGEHMADTEIILRSIAEGYGIEESSYEKDDNAGG